MIALFKIQLSLLECSIVRRKAMEIEKEKGYVFTEDAGRGYRRVVPSPIPKKNY